MSQSGLEELGSLIQKYKINNVEQFVKVILGTFYVLAIMLILILLACQYGP
jgi:hypothetical protein